MLNSLNIQRKLGLSFVLVTASAAVMMAVFLANILMIRSAIERAIMHKYVVDNGKVVDKAGVRQCIEDLYEYEQNANLVSVRGRLTRSETGPVAEDVDQEPED